MNKIAKAVAKAAGITPEARKAILLKVRKGADAAVTLAQTLHIIDLLGGSWELEAGLVPMQGVNTKTGRPLTSEFHTANPDGHNWINALHADYQARAISDLPSHAAPGERFITDVSPVGKNAYDWLMFTYVEWAIVHGIRIAMPDGKSALFLPSGSDINRNNPDAYVTIPSAKPYEHSILYDIKRWLKEETDYTTLVCRLLDMEEHVPAAERTRDNTGCCPVCFREIKLEPGRDGLIMVRHGFRRPRYAEHLVGNCYGVGRPPYELSNVGVIAYLDNVLLIELSGLEMDIASVENDALDAYPNTRQYKAPPIKRGQNGFEDARERYRDRLEQERKFALKTIALYQTLVDEWQPRDLPREGGPPRAWMREITSKIK